MKQTLLTASLIIACCLWGASAAQAAVVTGTYVATGADQTINLGFQPEIVMVKDGSAGVTSPNASALQIRTVGMTLTKDFGQGAANDTTGTDRITALTATGFTIGTGATVNTTGRTYHYLAMDEVPGEIKVGSYVGNATDNRNITGVGFQPDFVLTMPDAAETSIWRNSSMVGDFSLNWTEIAEDDQIQSLAADGFQIGSRASVNANGTNFIYIACKNVAGNFKTGTYTGTGAAASISGMGFLPEAVFIRRYNAAAPSVTGTYAFRSGGPNVSFLITTSNSVADLITSLNPDGFSVGTATRVNSSGIQYYYFGWKGIPAAASSGVQPLGTASQQFATSNTLSSYTVPAGTNRLLVVSTGDPSTPTNPATVTFGGTPMSLANSTSDGFISCDSIWYLPLGTGADVTGNIVVSFTGTLKRHIGAAAFSGVSQTSPVDLNGPKVSGSITGSNLAASLNVTSEAGDRVFDVVDAFNSTMIPTTTVGANQTVINTVGDNFGSNFYARYSTSHEAGDATVNMSWATQATAILHLTTNINQVGSAVSAPTVTSTAAASVMATTATLGGNITATGGADATARGVVYALTSANANPEIGGASVTVLSETGTFSTGAFSRNATTLTASSAYSFKAYATNSSGTSYGSVLTFTTSAAPVSVISLNRVNPTPTNAATVNWTLTFGSAVTGVTASNFSLSGAGTTGASVGNPTTSNAGLSWTVPVTTAADGTLTLSLANATGLSAPVGSLPYGGESYTIDKTAPTVLSVVRQTPSGQMTTATSVTFRVTYSEPVTGIAAARYRVVAVNGSNIIGTVTGITPVSTSVYDVAVSITSGTGEFRLRVID